MISQCAKELKGKQNMFHRCLINMISQIQPPSARLKPRAVFHLYEQTERDAE